MPRRGKRPSTLVAKYGAETNFTGGKLVSAQWAETNFPKMKKNLPSSINHHLSLKFVSSVIAMAAARASSKSISNLFQASLHTNQVTPSFIQRLYPFDKNANLLQRKRSIHLIHIEFNALRKNA